MIYLLKQNKINEKAILYDLISLINQIPFELTRLSLNSDIIRNQLLLQISKLSYFNEFEYDDESITIKINNNKIKIYQYDKFINDTRIYHFMKFLKLHGHCHEAVEASSFCI